MKKGIITVIIMLTTLIVSAQQYSEVVEIPNKTAVQGYRVAREWFAFAFRSANDVIQMDDSIQKKIISKGIMLVKVPVKNIIAEINVWFSLSVQFKDGRYKYDVQYLEIKNRAGNIFTYEELKDMGTENGLANYLEKTKTSWAFSKRGFQECLLTNKTMVELIDKKRQETISSLTEALKKDDKSNNW